MPLLFHMCFLLEQQWHHGIFMDLAPDVISSGPGRPGNSSSCGMFQQAMLD